MGMCTANCVLYEILSFCLPTHAVCKTQRTDVVFVVDSSRSIKTKDHKKLKEILASIIADLNIGPDDVQVGMFQFGRKVVREFGFTNYTTREELKQAFAGMQKIEGKSGTNIPGAVKAGVDLIRNHGRNVTKRLILFTDGRSTITPQNQTLQEAADYAAAAGVVNLAVGFGSRLQADLTRSRQEMRIIAQGRDENVFLQPDVAAVAELRSKLVGKIQCCELLLKLYSMLGLMYRKHHLGSHHYYTQCCLLDIQQCSQF